MGTENPLIAIAFVLAITIFLCGMKPPSGGAGVIEAYARPVLRKLHLVRPDLIRYPMLVETYA